MVMKWNASETSLQGMASPLVSLSQETASANSGGIARPSGRSAKGFSDDKRRAHASAEIAKGVALALQLSTLVRCEDFSNHPVHIVEHAAAARLAWCSALAQTHMAPMRRVNDFRRWACQVVASLRRWALLLCASRNSLPGVSDAQRLWASLRL